MVLISEYDNAFPTNFSNWRHLVLTWMNFWTLHYGMFNVWEETPDLLNVYFEFRCKNNQNQRIQCELKITIGLLIGLIGETSPSFLKYLRCHTTVTKSPNTVMIRGLVRGHVFLNQLITNQHTLVDRLIVELGTQSLI